MAAVDPSPLYSPQGLAMHTATGELGLALARGTEVTKQQTWLLERQLLNRLHFCLGEFFSPEQWSTLDYLAIARGPGSFTSVRIGMVAARTLAQQLRIPLFAISSLAGFAQSLVEQGEVEQCFGVTMAASRGYLYGALYQIQAGQLVTLDGDRLWLPDQWQTMLEQRGIGQIHAPPANLGYTVPQLLTLAQQQWLQGDRPPWQEAQPFYGLSPTDPVPGSVQIMGDRHSSLAQH